MIMGDTDGLDGTNRPIRRSRPSSQTPGTKVAGYCCPFCTFVTWSGPSVLSYHLRSHLGTQHCPICGVSAASKPALHQHIARRHIRPDAAYGGNEDYLSEAPDKCLSSCEPCQMVARYGRPFFGHYCFLCDYSDSNSLRLTRHVMAGHVQIAKTQIELNKSGLVQQPPVHLSVVSSDKDVGQNCSARQKPEGEAEREGPGEELRTPPQERQRHGKRKSLETSPPTMEPTHTSPSALSFVNDVTVPMKKRRKVSMETTNNEQSTATEKDNSSTRLSPSSRQQMRVQNAEAVTSRVTYNVGFCATWMPLWPSSPPVLEQEVPLDLSVRKAPPADLTESAMPVITSVFSWKDYL
ncbi:uncharacterized protein LOC118429632 [Branchiostoma floridae]|uniref:Uncharacterized protein LOC118429632 n=1 Tax=Branchiostoma floridae TaxID=7739 RepID=C3Y9C8_BRAFL|nr:uncharacterized protein LOC118429632 [Branchiostoma floridae]|eukprot:XP_002607174.1 hypothetical protein BRAFLDRAFT_118644 [Branchiostoma floridae]